MDPDNYSQKEIQEIIKEVLKKFYEKDKILIKNKTHEQAISHVIACYLAKKFEIGMLTANIIEILKILKNAHIPSMKRNPIAQTL